MWELDNKEGWVPKNWTFWTVVLEKTLDSPLDSRIKSINPKGNQSWIFIGRTDAEAEVPTIWSPDAKSWLIRKDSDAGKDRKQKEKEAAEDEMTGWHHQLNGCEFEQTLGYRDRTEEPAMLESTGLQGIRHHRPTEQWEKPTFGFFEINLCSTEKSSSPPPLSVKFEWNSFTSNSKYLD